MYGRENCFSVTGNLIIVIECNIGAFSKEIMGHISELPDYKWGKMGQNGAEMKKHQCLGFSVGKYNVIAVF